MPTFEMTGSKNRAEMRKITTNPPSGPPLVTYEIRVTRTMKHCAAAAGTQLTLTLERIGAGDSPLEYSAKVTNAVYDQGAADADLTSAKVNFPGSAFKGAGTVKTASVRITDVCQCPSHPCSRTWSITSDQPPDNVFGVVGTETPTGSTCP